MRRIITFLILVLIVTTAQADYRILFLNTPSISIGGRTLKVNDTFSPGATIKWSSPRQAMRVADTTTGEQRTYTADEFSKLHATSLKNYLAQTKHTSVDASGRTALEQIGSYLNDRFYILDSLNIETGVTTDDDHYFFISYKIYGDEVSRAVRNNNGTLTLTRRNFTFGGKNPEGEIDVKVYYFDKTTNKVTTVCEHMRVRILPLSLD